jgi:hypothetical protein
MKLKRIPTWLKKWSRPSPSESPELAALRIRLAEATRDRDGNLSAYHQQQIELGQLRTDIGTITAERDGYQTAYHQQQTELGQLRTDIGTVTAERDGYHRAYDAVATELAYLKADVEKLRRHGPWPQTCFMHVGKSAGTSVLQSLNRLFDPIRSYYGNPSNFDRLTSGELEHFDFVAGHFSYGQIHSFRPHRVLISIVREPVERVVSAYYFLRSWNGLIDDENRVMVASAQRFSLLDFLKDDHPHVRAVYQDHQTYTFASDWRADRTADGTAVLEAALSHLDDFALIGLTERVDDTMSLLSRTLRWPLFTPLKRANVTPNRPAVPELTHREYDAIMGCNRLDHQLYQEVKSRFEFLWSTIMSVTAR